MDFIKSIIIEPNRMYDTDDTGEDFQKELMGIYEITKKTCITRTPYEVTRLWELYEKGKINQICNPLDKSIKRNNNAIILVPKKSTVCCTGYCTYRNNNIWVNALYKGLYGFVRLDYLKKKSNDNILDTLNGRYINGNKEN